MTIPPQLVGQKYVSLTTFKRDGSPVRTPVWFAEQNGRLYFMTRNDSWKYKRIRNNPQVTIAPCNMRGTVCGPEISARARILPAVEWQAALQAIKRKYWLMRFPFWSKKNEFLEIEISS